VGKFICMDGRGHDPMTFKRNLHSFGVSPLILGGSACLFLKQPKSRRCDVTSCTFHSLFFEKGVYFNCKYAMGICLNPHE
jgi:hypothetical protein